MPLSKISFVARLNNSLNLQENGVPGKKLVMTFLETCKNHLFLLIRHFLLKKVCSLLHDLNVLCVGQLHKHLSFGVGLVKRFPKLVF